MKNTLLIIILAISLHSCKQKVQPAQSPVQVGSTVYEVQPPIQTTCETSARVASGI